MSHQVMPPADGLHNTITVNGRSYTCALGAFITVPDQDAFVMLANGWTTGASGGAGATSGRPANPTKNMHFLDTTLGYVIVWDGKVWRNGMTGAAV